mgnify:CR=1 FL=1
MNFFVGLERRVALRTPFVFLLYLVAALGLGAQAVNPGAQAPNTAPKAANAAPHTSSPAGQIPSSILLFNIRTAFSLSPSMVKQLQGRGEDQGAKQPEKPGEETSKAQAAPSATGASGGAAIAPIAPSAPIAPIAWTEPLARSLPVAAPLDLRLMGKNLIVILQILPIAVRDPIVDLFVHGQIWLTTQDNSISYKTTMESVSIPFGSRIYFYPLGADLKSGAPVAVEIKVDRSSLH